jgi:hypothetical protein
MKKCLKNRYFMIFTVVLLIFNFASCEWGFELDVGEEKNSEGNPPAVTVTGKTSNSISIAWQSVSDAYQYIIERSTSSSFSSAINNTTRSTSYTAAGLSTGVTYYFRVTAVDFYDVTISIVGTISAAAGSSTVPEPAVSGLTITGISSEYNGKYALAMSPMTNWNNRFSLTGAASYSETTLSFKAVKISNGKVVLPVWKLNSGETTPVEYTGSDNVAFTLGIFDNETIPTGNMENYIKSASISVQFYNGNASYNSPSIN